MEPQLQPIDEAQTEATPVAAQPQRIHPWLLLAVLFDLIIITIVVSWWILRPPADFMSTRVVIEPGQSVASIADELAAEGVVKNGDALYLALHFFHKDMPIKAGTYIFDQPANTLQIATYMVSTTPADELLRLTLPEGMRSRDYAAIAESVLEGFSTAVYVAQGEAWEGYLWPETYFIPKDYSATELLALQERSTQEALQSVQDQIAQSPLTEYEVLILASIVEREANSPESMAMVSGILQNRLAIGMALQADASIEYVLEAPLGELPPGLLASELRERESPYNTYLNTGLPPTPIGNPGLQAITAVLNPTPSDYLFYITGDDGNFYYAETFDQHRLNISRYLR